MNASLLTALLCLVVARACAHDSITPGAMSGKLVLSVSYEAAASRFNVVLRNQSGAPLTLCVEPQQFHGRIIVTPITARPTEYLDSTFHPLLLTSVWDVPVRSVQSSAEISWNLPLSRLCDIHGNKLPVDQLRGATVYATLDEIAVVPAQASYVSSNAKQISKPIMIPANPK